MVRHARVLGARRPWRRCRFGERDGSIGRARGELLRSAGQPAHRPAAGRSVRWFSWALAAAVAAAAPWGVAPPAAAGTASIRALSVEPGPEGPVLHVATTGPIEVVHYSPQPGVWVVEAPASAYAGGVPSVASPDLGIRRAEVALAEEYGKALTRLTVWLERPAAAELREREGGFDLVFAASAADGGTGEVEAAPVAAVPEPEEPQPARRGRNLYRLEAEASGTGVVVQLDGDGRLEGRSFTLPDPPRVVVDLPGVVCRTPRHVYPVGAAGVRRVRVAQFRAVPEPVTRVVVDLETSEAAADLDFRPAARGAALHVAVEGAAAAGTIEIAPARRAHAPEAPAAAEPEPAVTDPEPAPAVPAAPARVPAVAAPEPAAQDPFTADPSQLVEQAAAAQELDLGGPREFETREVESQERQYTGEPLSLTLKDADIKDVLRTFAQLTGLNIVVDPGVSGSVTVELHDVPWDQALDLILKINGLDYVLENNVLRVAPTSKLAAEKAARAKLAEQEELARPMKTIVKPLSYAKASEVSQLLQQEGFLLSQRGSIIVDQATNTLIIRDIVDRLPGIQKLITILDQPVPQVLIEARIVETTRNFSHKLGVNWGFSGVMDAEHGNDTGLNFPNTVSVGGGVNLGLGYPGGVRADAGTVGFSFGDILNTFNLDFLLSAAEDEGLVRIVSSPKVIAQNNNTATIRSGLQLPVQTVANNTVTVQYVDATLRLEVTPQITAEGTVVLDLDIKKQEPATALLVQGAQNAPIFTRDAKTKLLVRDGGTQVIGGIYQLNDQNTDNRVPGVHRIPILGWLFRGKTIQQRHDELLIFITPRIMKY